jgi:hypothetical protein
MCLRYCVECIGQVDKHAADYGLRPNPRSEICVAPRRNPLLSVATPAAFYLITSRI